jgi:MurNAc alpha-1-phosphate uridylyltransferase
MKAMILAAGRGERMRPLSDTTPKPLLKVRGKALIEWHLEHLAQAGFSEVIINLGHLGYKIQEALGNGDKYGIKITYSDEQQEGALESAGGIKKALPLLGDSAFLVLNGDVFCEYSFDANFQLKDSLAHLILVPNPPHNTKGDFGIDGNKLKNASETSYTFSGIGYYSPLLFKEIALQKAALAPLLRKAIEKEQVSGEVFKKVWHDVGTPQRLQEINNEN